MVPAPLISYRCCTMNAELSTLIFAQIQGLVMWDHLRIGMWQECLISRWLRECTAWDVSGVWCLYPRTERVYWEQAGGRLWIYVWLHVFSGAWAILYLGLDSPWWRKLLSGSKAGTFRKFINPLARGALLLAFSPSTLESKFPALAKPTSHSILCIVQTPLPLHGRVFRMGMFSSPKQVPGLKSSTLDSSFSKEVFPSYSVSLERRT